MSQVAKATTPEEKYKLITENLAEVLHGENLKEILKERNVVGYWGTAPTGRPHLGYFVPLMKIADLLLADAELKVLIADVHAFLDNMKAPIELVGYRAEYYQKLILAVFESLGVPTDKIKFVLGSSYQYSKDYNFDKYRLAAITTEHDARKAGAEVVKQIGTPLLSSLLYPLLQALDEEYLGVDFQFGGVDQRKIFTYADLYLPKIGYKRRTHLMNRMVPGLGGGKMSSSDPNSKIDFLETPESIKSKISKAQCAPGVVEDNGLLAFIRNVIIPIGELYKKNGRINDRAWAAEPDAVFTVFGNAKHNVPDKHFKSADELEAAYASEDVHPGDLKNSIIIAIKALLEPIQKKFANDSEFQRIEKLAYPPPEKPAGKKKEKKYTPKPDWVIEKERAAAAEKEKAAKGQSQPEGPADKAVEATQVNDITEKVSQL